MFYVMTGLLGELGTANQGVGYTLPFELVGAPWIEPNSFADALNGRDLPGIVFRPMSYKPFYFEDAEVQYHGVQLHVVDRQQIDLTAVQLTIIDVLRKEYPARDLFARAKADRISSFDKAAGTDELRKLFQAGRGLDEILEWGARQASDFSVRRQKYLLYD
jgi:uncharacterized protein YbbC (DUF1343 family)